MKIHFTSLKKIALVSFIAASSNGFAQCGNIGFESGTTTDWTCGSGTFGKTNVPSCMRYNYPLLIKYDGNCLNQGGIDGTATPTNGKNNRHTLITTASGNDPNSLNKVSCLAPAAMFPSGVNNYSFRLGNAVTVNPMNAPTDSLASAEGIKFKLNVDSTNTGLTYMYAVFLKEAMPTGHSPSQEPRFIVKIIDANDSIIKCDYKLFMADAPTLKNGLQDGIGTWKYSDWTAVKLNLTAHIGKTITIEFITADCYPSNLQISSTNGVFDTICNNSTPGSHSAYVYLDMYCAPYTTPSPSTACITYSNLIQVCAPSGYAAYNWPANQPGIQPPLDKQCVTIVNPKAGNSYTANLISLNGACTTPYSVTLKENDFQLTPDTSVCEKDTIYLRAVPVNAGNYDFKWEPGVGLSRYDIPDPLFFGGSMTYTVTMTDKNPGGCNRIETVGIFVKQKPVITVSDTTIHQGDTVLLAGIITGPTGGVWLGGTGTFIPDRFALNGKYLPSAAEQQAGIAKLTLKSADTLSYCQIGKTKTITILLATQITTLNGNNIFMNVYPNPFNTSANIEVSGLNNSAFVELQLFDYLGKIIRSQQLQNGTQKLERNNLANGMYFIEIREQGKLIGKQKIIIND
ncbi:MAG TPA: T9SS type A sorting domain-containing protein [Bacteroidia bacterium]|nr:T9SS type A sorting domain-containing protein [Bacteroidia bacterium]